MPNIAKTSQIGALHINQRRSVPTDKTAERIEQMEKPEPLGGELPQGARLRTARLGLRPFSALDSRVVTELLQEKEIARNTRGIPFPYSMEDAERWIEQQRIAVAGGEASVFAITRTVTGSGGEVDEQLIGCIGLAIDHQNENAELGYWLGQPYWNLGYMTEAAGAVLEYGFETLGLHRIYAHHMSRNPGSGRVLVKIGMQWEGRLREHTRKWGVFEDVELYGLLGGQWRSDVSGKRSDLTGKMEKN